MILTYFKYNFKANILSDTHKLMSSVNNIQIENVPNTLGVDASTLYYAVTVEHLKIASPASKVLTSRMR